MLESKLALLDTKNILTFSRGGLEYVQWKIFIFAIAIKAGKKSERLRQKKIKYCVRLCPRSSNTDNSSF